ncbi:MAG: PACE efflux transporter [Azovibrio sp.]|uniref:PACE efflux transporter n=1 Tax=Azovibrio sp. TaxID=1872673 RepID=UPI003C74FF66
MNSPPLRTLPDRLRQAILFELLGVFLITPLFTLASGEPLLESAALLALISLVASLWNAAYCTAFDWLEGRLTGRRADQRPQVLRLAHALGFEGGLLLFSLPVIMAWTGMDFWTVLVTDIGLALTYAGYAYLFNLAYDRLLPIPSNS